MKRGFHGNYWAGHVKKAKAERDTDISAYTR